MRVARCLHVALPLLVGVVVYVAWRSTEVTLVGWLPSSVVAALRGLASRVPLPAVVVGTAPDLAWGWSFGAAMGIVWKGRPLARNKLAWLGGGALVAAYAEIGQLWQLPPGRFDVVDLFAIVLGYAVGAAITSRPTSPRSTPSPRLLPHDRDRSAIRCTRG